MGGNCMDVKVGFTQSAKYTCLEDLQQVSNFSSINGVNLDYCGKEKCEPSYQFGPYVRKNYVIHIILEGKGAYKVGDKKFELSKGQAFLIYPKVETVYKADDEEPWFYTWIGFHGYRCEEFLRSMGFSPESPIVTLDNCENIEKCMNAMIDAKELTLMNELIRMSNLLNVFTLFMENNKSMRESRKDYPNTVYVKYAVDYIRTHIKEKIKIDDIAKTIGISRSYLAGSFKKELGMSPQEYMINLRLEQAASMLRKTSKPIHEIASDVGYDDSMAFSKSFKQKFDMSPKAFRETKVELLNVNEKGGYTINKNL
jgi:AraC-like DNA-binding protein